MGTISSVALASDGQATTVLSESFGRSHFGAAQLGDKRRTERLVAVAEALVRHPGGTLPEKFREPSELEALYHLMNCDEVTHARVLAPHRERTLTRCTAHDGPVLVLHDTTELDFTKHRSLVDMGPIGNGSRRGWLCHQSLVVEPIQREVWGLANQILQPRAIVRKDESQKSRREREDRESRLWLAGTRGLPAARHIVDVCDRGADTFEFLEHECQSGRTFVIRSCYSRASQAEHTGDTPRSLLHDPTREWSAMGLTTREIPAARVVHKPKKKGAKTTTLRPHRTAQLQVSAAPIRVLAPAGKNGQHSNSPLPVWLVRVWEPIPPEDQEPLEWFLLTNHPVTTFEQALTVISWYECRWMIEEFHKAQKTGCEIENPQFTSSDRLHPMIALLSVVAIFLLNLRESGRREDASIRPATDVVAIEYVTLLSRWRHGASPPKWTIHDFHLALARLGGHQNRKHDHRPGWLILWRGWTYLQAMLDGAHAAGGP